jgi:hypothetical protein
MLKKVEDDKYNQFSFDKGAEAIQWMEDSFSKIWQW